MDQPSVPVLVEPPTLQEHDFKTVRDLYGQAQNWARHYESLTVTTNTFFATASFAFATFGIRDARPGQAQVLLVAAMGLMTIALLLTRTLVQSYKHCVFRLMNYENLLNCFAPNKTPSPIWNGQLLPSTMTELPVRWPGSAKFFLALNVTLFVAYAILLLVSWLGAKA